MAGINHDGPKADGSQLRERPSAKPLHLYNSEDAKHKVLELNQEEEDNKHEEKRKTFGRTPDGTGKPGIPARPIEAGQRPPLYTFAFGAS